MSPSQSLQHFTQIRTTLGEEAYKQLSDQLFNVQTSIGGMFEEGHTGRTASVPAAIAASLILQELRRLHPHNPMSAWGIEHQLRALYAILAYENEYFFCSVYINFASDLEVEHVLSDFRTT